MKSSDSRFYESVIPKELNISVKESGKYVTINFLNELDLESMNSRSAMELVEGLLLTAKSSGYEKVVFHNIKQGNWGGFDFNQPIETPISANKKTLENE